jgi:hypothetical protein
MNFDNINSENRASASMVNNLIPGSRLNNLRNITRHCSFCREHGHNIRNCNNEQIIIFGNECQIKKNLCDLTVDSKNNFRDWLINYYLSPAGGEVVRAYAISKCNCTLRSNNDTIIEKIIDKIYQADYVEEEIIPIMQEDIMLTVRILQFLRYYSNVVHEESNQTFNITGTVVLLDETQSEELCDCAICYEEELQMKNFVTLNCQHKFCKDCLKNSLKSVQQVPTCALCRAEITKIIVHNDNIKDEFKELMNL